MIALIMNVASWSSVSISYSITSTRIIRTLSSKEGVHCSMHVIYKIQEKVVLSVGTYDTEIIICTGTLLQGGFEVRGQMV